VSIGSGAADIVGKGLIVHRDPDDYASQPAGNAGPRIACAVIRKA
jgi:Cu-Zn family superoxide dismutase